jgi:RNAse (barnase) inhibitor barstar
MQSILLDASGWRSPDDFYSALLPKLGAPDWHGRNLDALYDGFSGGINRLEPPFAVQIEGAEQLPSDMMAFLCKVSAVFEDARTQLGAEVFLKLR